MSNMKTEGVVTEGKAVPKIVSAPPAEHDHGSSMNPGFSFTAKPKMTSRTAAKHKAFVREDVPHTAKS